MKTASRASSSTQTYLPPALSEAGDPLAGIRKSIAAIPNRALLFTGLLLFVLSQMRWGIDLFAWFAPVPFLIYLRRERGWRSSLKLLGILILAMHLAVAKIVTPPLNYAMVPLFALPVGVMAWIPYCIWQTLRRRTGEPLSIYLFPSLVVVAEWMQSHLTEFGVWGTMAVTQVDRLAILQIASLFGASAISFLVAWGASLAAAILHSPENSPGHFHAGGNYRQQLHAAAFIAVLTASLLYGSFRLTQSMDGPIVRVAGINSPLILTESSTVNEAMHANTEALLKQTNRAADAGAKIVTWNEGSTILLPSEEDSFLDRAAELARSREIDFVPAYIVLRSEQPLLYDNEFVWIHPDGAIAGRYRKHHLVPGERAIRGLSPLRTVETKFGPAAGAICYDFDFPAISLRYGELGAGIVLLPSSDWKGIDPIHTNMARIRAIEGGFSVLRSTHASASSGFDAFGRFRGSIDYFEKNDGILLVSLPVRHVRTLYTSVGDILPLVSGILIAVAAFLSMVLKRR